MLEPYCVGLTGGIGCGKSSASSMFEALGAAVVDTDGISHDLTRAGGAAMPEIAREFGAEYLTPEGALDRAKMRERVFRDPASKSALERILHPLIRATARARIDAARAPYVVLVVPLLLETGAYRDVVKRVLVVDCDELQQIARTTRRSGLDTNQVRAIMATQLSRSARLAAADDVLSNDAGLDTLRRDVKTLHDKYVALATEHAQRSSPAPGQTDARE